MPKQKTYRKGDERPVDEPWLKTLGLPLRPGIGFVLNITWGRTAETEGTRTFVSIMNSKSGWGLYFTYQSDDRAEETQQRTIGIKSRRHVLALITAFSYPVDRPTVCVRHGGRSPEVEAPFGVRVEVVTLLPGAKIEGKPAHILTVFDREDLTFDKDTNESG